MALAGDCFFFEENEVAARSRNELLVHSLAQHVPGVLLDFDHGLLALILRHFFDLFQVQNATDDHLFLFFLEAPHLLLALPVVLLLFDAHFLLRGFSLLGFPLLHEHRRVTPDQVQLLVLDPLSSPALMSTGLPAQSGGPRRNPAPSPSPCAPSPG